jgi:hypothetical protein
MVSKNNLIISDLFYKSIEIFILAEHLTCL